MSKAAKKQKRGKRAASNESSFDVRFRDDTSFKKVETTLTARTQNQKRALSYLNSGTPIVLLTGSAGTGKSLLAAYRAATQLKNKSTGGIVLMRPAVATGKTIGLLPGEIEEKMAPYFRQTLIHLGKFLGEGQLRYALEKKQIEMFPVEYARGNSFENKIVIAEEAQNFTAEEFEMMFTRLGDNCQMIFTGDTKQHDLKGDSGLKSTINLLHKIQEYQPYYLDDDDMDVLDDGVGIVEFGPDDVIRSGITKAFVKIYFNN